MIGTGLPVAPSQASPPARMALPVFGQPTSPVSLGGVMTMESVSGMQDAASTAQSDAQLAQQQAEPVIQNLAGHIKGFFLQAETARLDVQNKMLEAMYARRGEYLPAKAAALVEDGQPLIYMMLPSVKMRQAEALLRDVFMGAGVEKPWTLHPTPMPDLPPQVKTQIQQAVTALVEQAIVMGIEPTVEDVRERLEASKVEVAEKLREFAQTRCESMEGKMEDQLIEGGFGDALDQFITDLCTFKAAFIAGPIVRRKPRLEWGPDGQPVVTVDKVLEFERVDPFDIYPAPWAKHINDGPLVRRHRLTRQALNEMLGVEGYSEPAIRKVLELYGTSGLQSWLQLDSQKARAEGKLATALTTQSALIDALQYWGSVSGTLLREWGMTAAQVPDPAKEYQIEAWCIGPYVIKAVLNSDPLARRNLYSDSYENVPGTVWGNSVYDLMRDCADMCNAAARALAANLGIASGPQVAVNISRLPPGEDVSAMKPWKIWQVTSDPMGSTAKAVDFFQPSSNAAELMGVYEKFSGLADEYTGIPKYVVGAESAGGAGRTASGMSMMLGNAGKIIRAVVGGVDVRILTPLLERLYYYNMRYSDDPDLKGDVRVVARGALSLAVKDSAQVRRNEFLQATMNPVDMQIIGLEGRAELLRASAQTLDLNTSKIVPPVAVLKDRQRIQQASMAAQQQAAGQPGQAQQPSSPAPAAPPPTQPAGNGQALMDGAPQTDNFQPA